MTVFKSPFREEDISSMLSLSRFHPSGMERAVPVECPVSCAARLAGGDIIRKQKIVPTMWWDYRKVDLSSFAMSSWTLLISLPLE